MEVIGAVSSVVALVETTSKPAKKLAHLAQRWRNAPEEINALTLATQELAFKFAYVEDTVTNIPITLLDDITRHGLMQLVTKANAANAELGTLRDKLEAYDTILIQRAKWAVKDEKAAKAILAIGKDIEEGLSTKGHSLTLQQSRETQQILAVGFAEMKQMFATSAIPDLLHISSAPTPPPLPSALNARTGSIAAVRRVFSGVPWEPGTSWRTWGLHGRVIKTTRGQATYYNIAIKMHLPLAWWFGSNILKGELAVSFPRQNTLTLRHPSYFAVARVLKDSHPFWEACRANDVITVRTMLRSGEARPTDEDISGYGALWYAIMRDNAEVVTELLDNGTDVDAAISPTQSTALEWATEHRNMNLLRLLLRRGASPDHYDSLGCDVYMASALLTPKANQQTTAKEMYDVLREYAVLDLETTRLWGATVLQVAAERVSGQDIKTLIALGSDPDAVDVLGNPALYHAVQYGNASAYFALLEQGARWDNPSCRSENLLFLALTGKAREEWEYSFITSDFEGIVRHLLRHREVHLGVRFRIPFPSSRYPESLWGRRATAKQLVHAYGPEVEAWFLGLVQEQCDLVDADTNECRLRASRLEPCAVQGCGICEDQIRYDDDTFYGQVVVLVDDDDSVDLDREGSLQGEGCEVAAEEQF